MHSERAHPNTGVGRGVPTPLCNKEALLGCQYGAVRTPPPYLMSYVITAVPRCIRA